MAFQHQPLLNAFEAARAIMVVSALIGKQHLFLDAEQWRTVPWTRHETCKTPQSEMLDILVMIPGILHDHAIWDASLQSHHTSGHGLQERVKIQLVTLYRWRWQWQARFGNEVCLELIDPSPHTSNSRRSRRLCFGRFAAASEIMLYNATLMWLLALLHKMDPLGVAQHIEACAAAAMPPNDGEAHTTSFQPLRRPGIAITIHDPAMEICRTFEWVTRHHKCSKEPTFLYLFPIGMAMTALQHDTENMGWIRALLNISPVTANYAGGENQAGFGFYLSHEALLAPDRVHAEKHSQLFSEQDLYQLSV